MKQYTETNAFVYDSNTNSWITKDSSNIHYKHVLKELEEAQATIGVYKTLDLRTWEDIRNTRNNLLKECDWVGLSDVEFFTKEKWLKYRQQLRDITSTFDSPQKVVWPSKPE